MAKPVYFEEADPIPATSRSASGAGPLPIKGFPRSTASCWELDEDELHEIMQTRRIWVITDIVTKDQMKDWPDDVRLQPTLRVTTNKRLGLSGW